jgi:4-alpha-glucanotransferase
MRRQGYRYLRDLLAHAMRVAGMLRLDHVMGLHRLFWIPHGFAPRDGVYVRYPAEEWYAVLTLESHRHRCALVGENLGTVPPEVHTALRRHHLLGLYVVQYEVQPDERKPLNPPPRLAVASLNTHDMPTFTAFWRGMDIQQRLRSGLLSAADARRERQRRERLRQTLARWLRLKNRMSPLEGCLRWLAASRARMVQISLEDLWAETRPQNVPGTGQSQPNWRRKWRYRLEQVERSRRVKRILQQIHCYRAKNVNPHGHIP